MATIYQRRRINKLTAEIKKIENYQYSYVDHFKNDPDAQIYALESKKGLLVRSIIIENHLAIEESLDDLIRIEVLKRNRRASRKRVTPLMARRYFNSTSREAQTFVSGGGSIGFLRKAILLRMLKLIGKRLYDDLVALNTLRNKCGHIWILKETKRRRGQGGGPQYTLSYRKQ